MARELALAGNSVVLMEQGPRMAPWDFEHDELKYRQLSGITNSPAINPQTFRRDESQKAASPVGRNPLTYARIVGGSSAHFNANFWRFHEIDFNEGSRYWRRSQAPSLADWPISYAELEPYYTKVEWEVGVSGLAGASPFDPPRSKPYPMPPLPVKSSGRAVRARRAQAGPAPVSRADGHQLGDLQGAPALRAVRLVRRVRLRGDGQVLVGVDRRFPRPRPPAGAKCAPKAMCSASA